MHFLNTQQAEDPLNEIGGKETDFHHFRGVSSPKITEISENREVKIYYVAVPVVDKLRHHFSMFRTYHEKAECLICVTLPSPSIFLKHFFMTQSEHCYLGKQFVHDGDGDGDVTNLNLPIVAFLPKNTM